MPKLNSIPCKPCITKQLMYAGKYKNYIIFSIKIMCVACNSELFYY